MIGLTLLAELIIIRINLFKILDETWLMGTVSLVLASTVPISILVRMLFVVRPAIKSEYELHSDHVVIHRGSKDRQFKFTDVAKVNYSWLSPRFFGGFNLELTSGQKFRFFSILENSHKVLEQLHEVRADVLVEEEYQDYIQASQRVSESWARLSQKLSNWKMLLVKYIVFPVLSAWFLWFKGWEIADEGNFVYILAIICLTLWALAGLLNHFEEKHLLNRDLDKAYEAKLDIIVDIAFFFLGISVVTVIASPLM